MRGSSGGRIGGRGAGGDDSYNRKICTWIDHGGRRCPMAAMRPHSQAYNNQQTYYATGQYDVKIRKNLSLL